MTAHPPFEAFGQPAAREHWEDVAERWMRTNPEALWRLHSDAVNGRLIERWLPGEPVGRLLKTDLFDEAVSPGLYPLLRTRARTVFGMDVSLASARRAGGRCAGLVISCADVRSLPYADGAFDAIVSNSTLDHFRTPGEIATSLRELRRVLSPDGQMVLTLDNRANPVVAVRNALPFPLLNRLGLLPYYVGATCTPRGLRRLLDDAGFEVREMDAILHCPRLMAIKISALLHRWAAPATQHRFLAWLMTFEGLARWPTRFLTGYYIAARLVPKRAPGPRKD